MLQLCCTAAVEGGTLGTRPGTRPREISDLTTVCSEIGPLPALRCLNTSTVGMEDEGAECPICTETLRSTRSAACSHCKHAFHSEVCLAAAAPRRVPQLHHAPLFVRPQCIVRWITQSQHQVRESTCCPSILLLLLWHTHTHAHTQTHAHTCTHTQNPNLYHTGASPGKFRCTLPNVQDALEQVSRKVTARADSSTSLALYSLLLSLFLSLSLSLSLARSLSLSFSLSPSPTTPEVPAPPKKQAHAGG